jgi:uncharacterized repeat protein (TIGR01451 family)
MNQRHTINANPDLQTPERRKIMSTAAKHPDHPGHYISPAKLAGISTLAIIFAGASVAPAYAAIDNTANASGTYGASTATSGDSSVSIPVVPGAGSLSVAKSSAAPTVASGADAAITDAGDTITYSYIVTNNGNVSISGVTPVDAGPTFNGTAGTNTLGAFTLQSGTLPLAPNLTATFTAVYTLSALDVYRAAGITSAVANSATATGTAPGGATVTSPPGTSTATIVAGPKLSITKAGTLDDTAGTVAGQAEAGETINYLYTVVNSGNVALTDVAINDTHEGVLIPGGTIIGETLSAEGPLGTPASTDTTANNGVWSVLQPGATITFTYAHLVTQAEVDAQ